jgi:outer membrane protein TolC
MVGFVFKRLLILEFAILVAPFPIFAQERFESIETLTLETALTRALAYGFPVEDAAMNVQIASSNVAAAHKYHLPVVEVFANETRHLTDESYTIEEGALGDFPATGPIPDRDIGLDSQSKWATVFGAKAVLPVSQQWQVKLAVDQQEVDEAVAKEELRSARQRLAEEVKTTYYDIVEIEAARSATQEDEVFLSELLGLVERYVEESVALAYEALEVKARLAASQQAYREQTSQLANEKEDLNRLMGRPIDVPFSVAGVLIDSEDSVSPARARADALANRPDVRAAQLRVERAETNLRLQHADFLPEVNLVASYLRPFDAEFIPDEYAKVSLEGRWEIFEWGRRFDEMGGKRIAVRKAKNEVRDTRAKVELEVNDRLRSFEDAITRVPVAEMAREAAREKLRVMMNRYREQSVLLERVLDAQAGLANANADVRVSKLQVLAARAQLERAMGAD